MTVDTLKSIMTGIAYGYGRCSRDDGDKMSPDYQGDATKQACAERGWPWGGFHCDDNVRSGEWHKRLAWSDLLNKVRPGDCIVVVESSRIGRNTRDTLNIVEDLKERGVSVLCLNLSFIDTSSAAGELIFNEFLNLYAFEARQLGERSVAGKLKARDYGRWVGGSIPFGYMVNPDQRGRLEIDPHTGPIVGEIFSKRAEGYSLHRITGELISRGITGTKHARPAVSSVKKILTNSVYIGIGKYSGEDYELDEKCVPRLVNRDLWNCVQAIERLKPRGAVQKRSYLLSGKLRCGKCGEVMSRHKRYSSKSGVKEVPVDYICRAAWDSIRCGHNCSGTGIRERKAEEELMQSLFEHIDDSKTASMMETREKPGKSQGSQIDSLQRTLSTLRSKQGRLIDLYSEATIDRKTLRERSQSLDDQIKDIEQRIDSAEAEKNLEKQRMAKLGSFKGLRNEWQHLSDDEKRSIVGIFIESATVAPGHGKKRLTVEWLV